MNKFKYIIAILMLLPIPAFAADAQSAREGLIVTLFTFTQGLALIIGLWTMIKFFTTLKQHADSPNDPSASKFKVLMILLTAVLLLNLNTAIDIMVKTTLGTEAYCFSLDPDATGGKTSDCFNPESSELTSELQKRLDSKIKSKDEFLKYVGLAMGAIQFLGLIFFVKGVLMIKQIGDGQGQAGPGKVIIALIFSALIIDLPHTMEVILATIKTMGVSL
jgi:hypothetical protein